MNNKLLLTSTNLFLIFIIISGFLFAPFIRAQEPITLGVKVNPQIFELDVWAGEKITKKIDLGNLSNVPIPIEVRMTDFTAEENSGEMIFDEALQDPSIASRKWFQIENSNFILETNGTREVQFTISVPENAEPGGHYATMLFEPRLPSFYFEEGQVRNIPVIGVLFLISVKTLSLETNTQQKLETVEFSLLDKERMVGLENFISRFMTAMVKVNVNIVETSPSMFVLKIKNNDIYHIKPSGRVLIYDFFGENIAKVDIPKRTILPGKVRVFPIEFSLPVPERLKWLPASISNLLVKNFFIGKYQAKLELKIETPLKAEIIHPEISDVLTFYSLPWRFWLGVMFILSSLIFITTKNRKRVVSALKVLIFNK